jgi:hypothetical protein
VGLCPRYPGFNLTLQDSGYEITRAFFEKGFDEGEAVGLVCNKATGEVWRGFTGEGVIGRSGSLLLYTWVDSHRAVYDTVSVSTYDLATRKGGVVGKLDYAYGVRLGQAQAVAVTPEGRVAWLDGQTLYALPAQTGQPFLTLDTGAITDLKAVGEQFSWTADGVGKSG